MSEVMKPMSVERADFIAALASLIENAKLPPFVIEPILRDVYEDISLLSKKQLEVETKKYNDAIKKSLKEET